MPEPKLLIFQTSDTNATEAVARRTPDQDEIRCFRPSYSPDNANFFRPLFDSMIADCQSKTITSVDTGFKVSTLYLKAQDALKWLADNWPDETQRMKYVDLRQKIVIRRVMELGVAFRFKPSGLSLVKAARTISTLVEWRERFEKWLSTAQSLEVWDSKEVYGDNIVVTPADREWLYKILAPLEGVEVDATDRRVRVMR